MDETNDVDVDRLSSALLQSREFSDEVDATLPFTTTDDVDRSTWSLSSVW